MVAEAVDVSSPDEPLPEDVESADVVALPSSLLVEPALDSDSESGSEREL
jgi:hypothetical protein